MSMYASLELCLNFHSFRNIDLFHQGLYHIRTNVYSEKGRIAAIPYALSTSASRTKSTARYSGLLPAYLNDENCHFASRTFRIRYNGEEVDLNDVGYFRLEVKADNGFVNENIMVVSELMYADPSRSGNDTNHEHFTSISKSVFRLRAMTLGGHRFLPVVFDEWHFCMAQATFHCVLVEFRWKHHRHVQALPSKPVTKKSRVKDSKQKGSIDVGAVDENHGTLSQFLERMHSESVTGNGVARKVRKEIGTEFIEPLQESYRILSGALENLSARNEKNISLVQSLQPSHSLKKREPSQGEERGDRSAELEKDINFIAGQIYELWLAFLSVVTSSSEEVVKVLKEEMHAMKESYWLHHIHRKEHPLHERCAKVLRSKKQDNARFCFDLRMDKSFKPPVLEDLSHGLSHSSCPIFHEERYLRERMETPTPSPHGALLGPSANGNSASNASTPMKSGGGEGGGGGSKVPFSSPPPMKPLPPTPSMALPQLESLNNERSTPAPASTSRSGSQSTANTKDPAYGAGVGGGSDDIVNPDDLKLEIRTSSGPVEDLEMTRHKSLEAELKALQTPEMPSRLGGRDSEALLGDTGGHASPVLNATNTHRSEDGVVVTPPPETFPDMVIEDYVPSPEKSSHLIQVKSEPFLGSHVFVFVHGFQGNSYDLRLLRNHMSILYPKTKYLLSSVNEESTHEDIAKLGSNLAKEVLQFIEDDDIKVGRLSFVGHSLGTIIVRACIQMPEMEPYLPLLGTFVSLSGPHLGYMFNSHPLFDSGLWVLKNWKKSESLKQLTMTDHSDQTQTFLFKLSEAGGLEKFRHVIFFSSGQDRYIPFHSARVEMCPEVSKGRISSTSKVYLKMMENLLGKVDRTTICRIDVNFGFLKRSLDSAIGRAAHILFLESVASYEILLNCYKEMLQ